MAGTSNTVAALQRPMVFPGKFDIIRLQKQREKFARGETEGRYKVLYKVSNNDMDNSINEADTLFKLKNDVNVSNYRVAEFEQDKKRLDQQPLVSANIKGMWVGLERIKKYDKENLPLDRLIRQIVRDSIEVEGLARYNILFDPKLKEQKDPAIIKSGTMSKLVNGPPIRAGQLVCWDAPLPSDKQWKGTRDIKDIDSWRLRTVPLDTLARISLEGLVEWCERQDVPEAKQVFHDPDAWVTRMKQYIKQDGPAWFSIEGKYLNNLLKGELMIPTIGAGMPNVLAEDLKHCTKVLRMVHFGILLHKKPLKSAWESYVSCVDQLLNSQIGALLQAQKQMIGKCTRSGQPGGYMDLIVNC